MKFFGKNIISKKSDQLNAMWGKIQENEFESETEELLHYYRTQTLTKDYSDFLLQSIKSNKLSQSAIMLLEKRPRVILEGKILSNCLFVTKSVKRSSDP